MRIPITYSHIEELEKPRYVANNDIELATAATQAYNKVIAEGGTPQAAEAAANDVRIRSNSLTVQDA